MKLKTSKSARKRFKITGKGRIIRRAVALNHFNAKDSGKQRRQRRETKRLSKNDNQKLNQLLPYDIIA